MKFNELNKGDRFNFDNDANVYEVVQSSTFSKTIEETVEPFTTITIQDRPLHFSWNFDVLLQSK